MRFASMLTAIAIPVLMAGPATYAAQPPQPEFPDKPIRLIIGSAPGDNISGVTLSGQLNVASVTITTTAGPGPGNGDIFVNDAVTWSASGTPTTLTLTADRNVSYGNSTGILVSVSGTIENNYIGVLPDGVTVRVGAAVDEVALRCVLAALGRR